jgi:hypothetical protein
MKPTLIAQMIFALQRVAEVVGQSATERQPESHQTLFDFEKIFIPNDQLPTVHYEEKKCKTYPADADWPTSQQWQGLNSTLNDTLIKAVPEASICYSDGATNSSTQCQSLTDTWNNSTLRISDPTSIRSILFQGMTCMPPSYSASFLGNTKTCDLGGFPEYILNATNVAQIQLAVQFARMHNIRLVVKNTGHDFGAKSVGKGALSVWTHYLKDTEYVEKYEGSGYVGKAVNLAAGVQVFEAYALAKKYGITLVGGEGKV